MRLTESDLKFVVETVATKRQDHDHVIDLIRGKVSDLLGEARSHLARLEADFRRERLPAPAREQPFPDRTAVQAAQALERVQKDIEAIGVKV